MERSPVEKRPEFPIRVASPFNTNHVAKFAIIVDDLPPKPSIVTGHDMIDEPTRQILCCPGCRSKLRFDEDGLAACLNDSCQMTFPAADARLILINEANSTFAIADFVAEQPAFFKPVGQLRRIVSSCLPHLSRNLRGDRDMEELRKLLLSQSDSPTVLIVGGGVLGAGVDVLANDPDIALVETDAGITPRVQIVCDAHDLPFLNESFDAVIAQAVLHHVADAPRCVAEMHRVLKPNGLVYADTGFMVQVHGREYDFARYTLLGHRRLFRYFDEIRSGMSLGPGTALAWSLKYFLLSFTKSQGLRRVVGAFSRLAFFWLKYFDYMLATRPAALDAAAGIVFLGRKRAIPIADRDMMEDYRGGLEGLDMMPPL